MLQGRFQAVVAPEKLPIRGHEARRAENAFGLGLRSDRPQALLRPRLIAAGDCGWGIEPERGQKPGKHVFARDIETTGELCVEYRTGKWSDPTVLDASDGKPRRLQRVGRKRLRHLKLQSAGSGN